MKILIVEDEKMSRVLLQKMSAMFGSVDTAVDGQEGVDAFRKALEAGQPYDLVCLDVMMPLMDGQTALKAMRDLEEARGTFSTDGTKIIMTTAMEDMKTVAASYRGLCDGYLAKPIEKAKLLALLKELKLIP